MVKGDARGALVGRDWISEVTMFVSVETGTNLGGIRLKVLLEAVVAIRGGMAGVGMRL